MTLQYCHHDRINGHFSRWTCRFLLGPLPPPALEENLWKQAAKVLFGVTCPSRHQINNVRASGETKSNNPNHEKSPAGVILSSATTGFLKSGTDHFTLALR